MLVGGGGGGGGGTYYLLKAGIFHEGEAELGL